ncbi:hypothetical protein PENSUB_11058 [Penicillium subrubescens]|uniref:Uncharacterized protein n=1 Tax=Penicillium subrubescens TaxID=1316194 RepID=A0A1Q5T5M6_9EURO|nr:hypothetical protein PENSUB_11058 [Penicillium subrubescens]
MDTDKSSNDAGFHERLTRHSSAFSLSLSFRGSSKRGSSRQSSHLRRIFRRSELRTSSSDFPGQTDGTPTFPRRTLHKARSGLLALRAGLFGRPPPQGNDPFENETKSLPKQGHTHRRTHGFSDISSSTQEDLNFGTDLYRNGRAQPRTLDDLDGNVVKQVPSFHPLKNTVSAPQPRTSSCVLVDDSEPAFDQTVSTPADQPFAYESYQDNIVTSHIPDEETFAEPNPSIIEDIQKDRADYLTPSVASEDRHTPGSLSANSTDEDNLGGTSLQCYKQNVDSEQKRDLMKNWLDHEQCACEQIEELRQLSETRNVPSLEMQLKRNDSSESLALPDYSTPSLAGSKTPEQRGSLVIRTKAPVTQERVLLGDDSLEPQACESPVSESRKCSANVKIAFPGLYHELLEQWVRENELSPTLDPEFPRLESETTLSTVHLPSIASTTSSHLNPNSQPHHPTELPWSLDTHLNTGLAHILNNFHKGNALVSFTPLACPRVVTAHCVQDSITFPCNMDDYTRQARQAQANTENTGTREVQSDRRRHSFGIHVSERNESASRSSSTQVSRPEILRRSSEDQQRPVNDPPFPPHPGLWGAADSQCDSDLSTSYNQDNSAINSANYTSPTSISSAPWSPLDSPIDEEALFRATHRDEYWMADGKNSSYYPDRGDLPVKGEHVAGDGRIFYASGSGRGSSSRVRQLTRADFSNTMQRSFRRDAQASEEQDDGEPDEDAPPSSQAQA